MDFDVSREHGSKYKIFVLLFKFNLTVKYDITKYDIVARLWNYNSSYIVNGAAVKQQINLFKCHNPSETF